MTPRGVIAIYTNPEGRVVANAADFSGDCVGGYKLADMQERRAKFALYPKVIDAYCAPIVSQVLSDYEREQLVRKLGGKVQCIAIGHDQ